MLNYFCLILFLLITPMLFGIPYGSKFSQESITAKYCYSYVMGFFIMLALFEIVFFPSALANLTFRSAAIVYTLILLLSLGYS